MKTLSLPERSPRPDQGGPRAWEGLAPGTPPEPVGRYPCPCCGYLTLPVPKEQAIAFICPVCYWENDVFDPAEDAPSDENHGMTLREGRGNYGRYGAVRSDFVKYVRPPRPDEIPEKET